MSFLHKSNTTVYTIAEMSANHAGSLENALDIVRAAKKSGADCLKIQTYTADSLTIDCDKDYFKIKGGLWDGYTFYDLYEKAATPYEWQASIKAECDQVGIDFLSTPFDEAGADFLESLGVDAYKIASFELTHIPLLRHIAKKGKPMIVSCGMGTVEEIQDAVDVMTSEGLSREQIVLLKCTSEYPAKVSEMNLITIPDMIACLGTRVGLSDHSIGSVASVAAVALGATVIEKHFCLSRKIKNPDSDFSTEPEEFAEMVTAVKDAHAARGGVFYGPTERESESILFRRSVFAVRDMAKGEIFTKDNIQVIRPAYGIKPKYYGGLLGKKCKASYRRGEPIPIGEL